MIVVTMTSWTKRINNVKKVIDSVIENTIVPDRLYLNLSLEEFPNRENDLPKELVELFEGNDRLIINWVEGNTKSFKKVFPILQYLDDDDIIIDADDDILLPKDLIESRVNDFEKCGRKYQISSNGHKSIGMDNNMHVVSAMSLFTKKMFNNWEKFVNDTVIKTYNDDRTYLYLIYLNGWRNIGPSKYTVQELVEKYDMKFDNGITNTKQGFFGRRYDIFVDDEIKRITSKTIKESFGFWK